MAIPCPAVSVIIPAYSVAAYIDDTLRSVFDQTFKDFEVVVVNDGSPDTTRLDAIVYPYREKLLYITQENKGVAAARNAGLRLARGEFVAFLDGDDVWEPNFLAEQVRFIQSNGGFDVVYADAYHFGEGWDGRTFMETSPSQGNATCESLLAGRCNIVLAGTLARRQTVIDAGLFDEARNLQGSEDYDLWIRISKLSGSKINYQRAVLAGYRHRPGSLSAGEQFLHNSINVFNKIMRRGDLTISERNVLENTIRRQTADLQIRQAKQRLASGDFEQAAELFKSARKAQPSWKLSAVMTGLKLAPRACQRASRWYDRVRTGVMKNRRGQPA